MCITTQEAERVMQEWGVSPITLTLNATSDGYSLSLPGGKCTTIEMPYDEECLLKFIETGSVPHFLLDILDQWNGDKLFFRGCLLVKILDRRYCKTGTDPPVEFIVLRPTQQSVNTDLKLLIAEAEREGHAFSDWEKIELECSLIALTGGPLDVDDTLPSATTPAVSVPESVGYVPSSAELAEFYQQYRQQNINRKRRCAEIQMERQFKIGKLFATDTQNSKPSKPEDSATFVTNDNYQGASVEDQKPMIRELNDSETPPPVLEPEVTMSEYCPGSSSNNPLSRTDSGPDFLPCLTEDDSTIANGFDIYATDYKSPLELATPSLESFTAVAASEQFAVLMAYNVEPSPSAISASSQVVQITVKRSHVDQAYWIELSLNPVLPGPSSTGLIVQEFLVGTEWDATSYVQQYLDMVTEEGRKQMLITKTVPGSQSEPYNPYTKDLFSL